jgi:hypothetical protein
MAVIKIMAKSTGTNNDIHSEKCNAGELEPVLRRLVRFTDEQYLTIASIQVADKLTQGSPGDEQGILFTSEAQADGIAATTLRLTTKRSQHVARSWRREEADKTTMPEYLRRLDEEEGYQSLGVC